MYGGHGLMWGNIYSPDKPKVRRRIDWKRIGALFAAVLAAIRRWC